MLTECFVAGTEFVKPPVTHLSSNLKDVGIFLHEFQPQSSVRQGFKKSSVAKNCLATSETHIFAAQAGKAIINVYNREKNNQESAVPFPHKITSIAYAHRAAILIIGTQDGRLILWEIATGRVNNSSASHIEPVTSIEISPCGEYIVSGSTDAAIHVWSLQNLVRFETEGSTYGGTRSAKDPASTFSHHRSAIEALAVGHTQRASSNIVVSASTDKTCYVWNLENLTILRTILLIQAPLCAVLDPADRAVYFGSSDGSIQSIDLLGNHRDVGSAISILATSQQEAVTGTQLDSQDNWKVTGASGPDPAQCITISYDGTSLVTGHYSGALMEWDIGKRRMGCQLSTLSGQSVTNIHMLHPTGLTSPPEYIIPTVIRPRLELSAGSNGHSTTSSLPADYMLNVRVLRKASRHQSVIGKTLTTPETSQDLLDDAIRSLVTNKVSREQPKQPTSADEAQNSEVFQKELAKLKAQLVRYEELHKARMQKHLARVNRRENLGLQKRQAFFAAKKQGKNGDEAMKPFVELEKDLDEESDDEVLVEAAQVDTPMPNK